MIAIENKKMLNVCHVCDTIGFTPKLVYSFNTANKKLTLTDSSTFTTGNILQIINVTVTVEGIDRIGSINTAGGSIEIDLSGMNTSNGFNIKATVVSKNKQTADLSSYEVASKIGSTEGEIVENNSSTVESN